MGRIYRVSTIYDIFAAEFVLENQNGNNIFEHVEQYVMSYETHGSAVQNHLPIGFDLAEEKLDMSKRWWRYLYELRCNAHDYLTRDI